MWFGRVCKRMKGIVANVVYLYLSQAANYIFPIITIPFLARVLGKESFGQYGTALSLAQFGQILIEYGFSFWGSREVSLNRNQVDYLQRLVSGVMGARVILLLAFTFILIFYLTALHLTVKDKIWMFVAVLLWVLSWVLNPAWFYQGLEKMRVVALLDLGTRAVATVQIFILVNSREEWFLPVLLLGLSFLIGNIVALGFLWKRLGPVFPSLSFGYQVLKKGAYVFLYRAGVSMFTVVNPVFLALLSSPVQVAYYLGSEKLSRPLLGLLDPLNRAVYPRIALLQMESPRRARVFIRRLLFIVSAGSIITVITAWLLAPYAVTLFLGVDYGSAVPILRIFLLLLIPASLSKTLGAHVFLARRRDELMGRLYITAGILNVLIAPVAAVVAGAVGVAVVAVLVETWIFVAMLWHLRSCTYLPT